MKKHLKKKLKWLIIVLVILSIMPMFFTKETVEGYKVIEKEFIKTFAEEGTIKAKNSSNIYSKVAGEVLDVSKEEGDVVKKGDKILEIDTFDIESSIKALEANLKSTIASKNQRFKKPNESEVAAYELEIERLTKNKNEASEDLDEAKKLFSIGAISKSELDTFETTHTTAKNLLDQKNEQYETFLVSFNPTAADLKYYEGLENSIRSEIEILRNKLDDKYITAPIDGVISIINAKKGENVTSIMPVATVYNKENYEIEAFIKTNRALEIKNDTEVIIIQETGNIETEYKGSIKFVSESAEEKISALGLKEKKVKIIVVPEEEMDLRPEFDVDLRFITHKEVGIVIPKISVFDEKIIKIDGNTMAIQNINILNENDTEYLLEKLNIKVDDVIVYDPADVNYDENKKVKIDIRK